MIDRGWYRASGLRASESHRVEFTDAPVLALLGGENELLRQPWFARDGVRTAATWAGIADGIFGAARTALGRTRARRASGEGAREDAGGAAQRSTVGWNMRGNGWTRRTWRIPRGWRPSAAPRSSTRAARSPTQAAQACGCAVADRGRCARPRPARSGSVPAPAPAGPAAGEAGARDARGAGRARWRGTRREPGDRPRASSACTRRARTPGAMTRASTSAGSTPRRSPRSMGARIERGLEVGCSIGAFTELLADRCAALTALDFSARAVALAARRLRERAHVSDPARRPSPSRPRPGAGIWSCARRFSTTSIAPRWSRRGMAARAAARGRDGARGRLARSHHDRAPRRGRSPRPAARAAGAIGTRWRVASPAIVSTASTAMAR